MQNFSIGIDFSKKTMDVTVLSHEKLNEKGVHEQFENSRKGARKLTSWVKKVAGTKDKDVLLFCGENSGMYSFIVSSELAKAGYFMWLESPLRIKRSMGISRRKDDKKDSLDIALYATRFRDQARRFTQLDEELSSLKTLFTTRRMLVKQLGAFKRRSDEFREVLGGNKKLAKAGSIGDKAMKACQDDIKRVEKLMLEIIQGNEEIKRTYEIMTSMPGVSFVNATAFIVYTDNFKKFDFDARKISSFWGVAPFGKESGTSLHTTPHVSRYADKYLKSLLSQAAICAMRYCPVIREYAGKLIAKKKHLNIVRNNVKNKMIHILVAMVRDGKEFQPGN